MDMVGCGLVEEENTFSTTHLSNVAGTGRGGGMFNPSWFASFLSDFPERS